MENETKTNDYKKKQFIAREIESIASTDRVRQNSVYEMKYNDFGTFIDKIKSLDCFAAKVAETVDKTMNPYNRIMARVSSKQAWILACAAVDNGITLD